MNLESRPYFRQARMILGVEVGERSIPGAGGRANRRVRGQRATRISNVEFVASHAQSMRVNIKLPAPGMDRSPIAVGEAPTI